MIDVLGRLIDTSEKLSEYLLAYISKDFDIPDTIYSPWQSAITDAKFSRKKNNSIIMDETYPAPDVTCGYKRTFCIRGNVGNCSIAIQGKNNAQPTT